MATTKLYLDVRHPSKDGRCPLLVTISHHDTRAYVKTGVRLLPSEWDGERIIGNPRRKSLTMAAEAVKSRIDTGLLTLPLREDRNSLSARDIKGLLTGDGDKKAKPLLKDAFTAYMDGCRTDSTRSMYGATLRKIENFVPVLDTLKLDDIDKSWLRRFDGYMSETMGVNGKNVHLRNLRAVMNYAIDEGLTDSYPFRGFNMRTEPTRKRTLSVEDIRRIASMPLEPWQEEYRDMFMLMFYLIGINAADLFSARPSQLVNGRLEYVRMKTRHSSAMDYSVKVEPEAMDIIDRYRGKDFLLSPLDRYRSHKDYLHHMNDALKTFGLVYKSGKKPTGTAAFPELSSYWARHTWASLAYEVGVPVDIIGQGLGHTDSGHAITWIYIKPDQRKVDEANRMVMDFVLGGTGI